MKAAENNHFRVIQGNFDTLYFDCIHVFMQLPYYNILTTYRSDCNICMKELHEVSLYKAIT
jgi:hypothetical protein